MVAALYIYNYCSFIYIALDEDFLAWGDVESQAAMMPSPEKKLDSSHSQESLGSGTDSQTSLLQDSLDDDELSPVLHTSKPQSTNLKEKVSYKLSITTAQFVLLLLSVSTNSCSNTI